MSKTFRACSRWPMNGGCEQSSFISTAKTAAPRASTSHLGVFRYQIRSPKSQPGWPEPNRSNRRERKEHKDFQTTKCPKAGKGMTVAKQSKPFCAQFK